MNFRIVFCFLFLLTGCKEEAKNLELVSNINYGPHERNTLDIYIPKKKNFSTVMFIHGGGWQKGNKDIYGSLGYLFTKNDIGCVVINYRLSPEVKHPAHIQDVALAFCWIYNNIGKYGGNPNKIYVMGHSAGAQLAALLGTNDEYFCHKEKIQGIIAVSGVYDFDIVSIKWAGLEHIFTDKKDRESASPIRHISKNTPQFLLFYAENDYFTLDSQAIDMHNCLRTNGVRSVLWQVPKRDHETILFDICDPDSKTSKNIIGFVK